MPYSPWCHECPHCMVCPKHGPKTGRNLSGKPRCLECDKENAEDSKKRHENYHREYRRINGPVMAAKQREKNKNRDPEYWCWKSINSRCHDPKSDNYLEYGGRKEGPINVCERWRKIPGRKHKKENAEKYKQFRIDVGPRPSKIHSLDRIDVNGNYELGNVRWATPKEQANNRRNNVSRRSSISDDELVFYKSASEEGHVTLKQFAEITGLHIVAVKNRYAQHPFHDYILEFEYDNRNYEWHNYKYNITEISWMSNLPYSYCYHKLKRKGWTVEDLMGY